MAKSGQYMPQRSQPLHFSGATTCGGWYPLELKAEESASTFVGQNSTQKPHALQRSTTMETRPFATNTPEEWWISGAGAPPAQSSVIPAVRKHYGFTCRRTV